METTVNMINSFLIYSSKKTQKIPFFEFSLSHSYGLLNCTALPCRCQDKNLPNPEIFSFFRGYIGLPLFLVPVVMRVGPPKNSKMASGFMPAAKAVSRCYKAHLNLAGVEEWGGCVEKKQHFGGTTVI